MKDKYPDKILVLPIPRMEILRDRMNWKYGFCLTAHETIKKFLAPSREEALKWYNKMKHMCNVAALHISKDYILGKTVLKNNYSKVHFATTIGKDKGLLYTVRSVFKGRLFEHEKSLVNKSLK